MLSFTSANVQNDLNNDAFLAASSYNMDLDGIVSGMASMADCEELALKLLSSLPRSRLASIQRSIAPLLQFDVVGSLPAEVSLQIFSYLSFQTLLISSLVSRRWHVLANDQTVWRNLCQSHGWRWYQPIKAPDLMQHPHWDDSDDEGMGDSDEEDEYEDNSYAINDVEAAKAELSQMQVELDSGFASLSSSSAEFSFTNARMSLSRFHSPQRPLRRPKTRVRYSAPSILGALNHSPKIPQPNYKLLYQTHMRLRNRIESSNYRLSALQTRGAPTNAHSNTIYCLQLYTYPQTNRQVLFTGSRDRTIREWNLATGMVERVIGNIHSSSILSICAHNGYIASASSDKRVVLWNLEKNELVKVLRDHLDSVLCVRFDDERLVSCSKDRTVRTYSFPDLTPQFILDEHRAAVNAVSISQNLIVSGSGDRSIRLWDATTGKLLRTFDDHHSRGIASIDFRPPFVLSGSSDKHLRLFDITTLQGWCTSPDYEDTLPSSYDPLPLPFTSDGVASPGYTCRTCGSCSARPLISRRSNRPGRYLHGDLVRSVALGEDLVVSGSYDLTIKVWDRKTGALVADLTGGHTGRIFCIGADSTKIVSCGEDQKICIWDFSNGIDISFVQL